MATPDGLSGPAYGIAWVGTPTHSQLFTADLGSEIVSWDVQSTTRLVHTAGPTAPVPDMATAFGRYVVGAAPGASLAYNSERLFRLDLRTGNPTILAARFGRRRLRGPDRSRRPRQPRRREYPSGVRGEPVRTLEHERRPQDSEPTRRRVTRRRRRRGDQRRRSHRRHRQRPRPTHRAGPAQRNRPTNHRRALRPPRSRSRHRRATAVRSGRAGYSSPASTTAHHPPPPRSKHQPPRPPRPHGDSGPSGGPPSDNRLGLIDLRTGALIAQTGLGDIGAPSAVAWSHDGRYLAVGDRTGALSMHDADTLTDTANQDGAAAGYVLTVSFSPDDSTLVSAGTDGTMSLWSAPDLRREGPPMVSTASTTQPWRYAWYQPGGTIAGLQPADATATGPPPSVWFTFPAAPARSRRRRLPTRRNPDDPRHLEQIPVRPALPTNLLTNNSAPGVPTPHHLGAPPGQTPAHSPATGADPFDLSRAQHPTRGPGAPGHHASGPRGRFPGRCPARPIRARRHHRRASHPPPLTLWTWPAQCASSDLQPAPPTLSPVNSKPTSPSRYPTGTGRRMVCRPRRFDRPVGHDLRALDAAPLDRIPTLTDRRTHPRPGPRPKGHAMNGPHSTTETRSAGTTTRRHGRHGQRHRRRAGRREDSNDEDLAGDAGFWP